MIVTMYNLNFSLFYLSPASTVQQATSEEMLSKLKETVSAVVSVDIERFFVLEKMSILVRGLIVRIL